MNHWTGLIAPLNSRPGDACSPQEREQRDAINRERADARWSAPRAVREPLENPWGLRQTYCTVLNLMVEGRKTAEIAVRMGISPKTVEDHRAAIVKAMQARNSIHAAVMWDRHVRGRDE